MTRATSSRMTPAGHEPALLTAAAWRYYLPVVMVWCLPVPGAVDRIPDNLRVRTAAAAGLAIS
jgi:hypothetical protein